MRLKKISALALVVAAAGLSLTACNGNSGAAASTGTNPSSSAISSSSGSHNSASGSSSSGSSSSNSSSSTSSSSNSGSGSALTAGHTPATGSMCKTDNLGFSASSTGVKNEIVVNLKNNGSSACSMHGFPGVQLVGPDGLGDTGPDAARTDISPDSPSTVTIAPGEETRFLLNYLPDTSGSGKTYTRLSVTPPNETVSEIVDLGGQTITVPAPSGDAPDVYVDPIGYHVGSGK
jgi:hypothetical protein